MTDADEIELLRKEIAAYREELDATRAQIVLSRTHERAATCAQRNAEEELERLQHAVDFLHHYVHREESYDRP